MIDHSLANSTQSFFRFRLNQNNTMSGELCTSLTFPMCGSPRREKASWIASKRMVTRRISRCPAQITHLSPRFRRNRLSIQINVNMKQHCLSKAPPLKSFTWIFVTNLPSEQKTLCDCVRFTTRSERRSANTARVRSRKRRMQRPSRESRGLSRGGFHTTRSKNTSGHGSCRAAGASTSYPLRNRAKDPYLPRPGDSSLNLSWQMIHTTKSERRTEPLSN